MIALQGASASVRYEDLEAMREGGVPENLFAEVETVLAFHCRPDRIAEQRQNVAKVLVEVGAIPSETNIDRALSAFARAKSEANFRNLPTSDELDVDALIADTQAQTHSIAWTAPSAPPDAGLSVRGREGPTCRLFFRHATMRNRSAGQPAADY